MVDPQGDHSHEKPAEEPQAPKVPKGKSLSHTNEEKKVEKRAEKKGDSSENKEKKMLCQCKYCDIPFIVSELDQHELYCGSRTKKCPVCHDDILVSKFEKHFLSCENVLKEKKRKGLRELAQKSHKPPHSNEDFNEDLYEVDDP